MSIKEVLINGIVEKSKKYPWMETFYITDEEIQGTAEIKVSKRKLNRLIKSLKPVFSVNEIQRYRGKKIIKYSFNSWKLAEKVHIQRNGNNTEFFSSALKEYMNI